MDFISVQDAAKNWGISERRIQKLCEENRIEGAVKFSRLWLIPRNAQKPSDRRRKELPKIENIIESYGQYVYNLALKLSANPEYADDLTQETFIKAWLHIKELRSPEAIKKWLRIICINEFRMSLRKQQRENNVEYFESIEELERDVLLRIFSNSRNRCAPIWLCKFNAPNCIKVFERNCKYTSELESPRSFGYGF